MRLGFWLGVLLLAGTVVAAPSLTVTPITWNVIGLDSNKVADGPNVFPVGVRVCNVGTSEATGVAATYVRMGAINPFIALQGNATIALGTIPAGGVPPHPNAIGTTPANCADAYFNVEVTRTASVYNTAQRYRIDVNAAGLATTSSPTPRELFVEKLVSQNRNSVISFTGPTTVYVGETYSYTLIATTAPGGYAQLEAFPNFPNTLFQILSVETTYTQPLNSVNSTVYADACGWVHDPTSPDYLKNAGGANCSNADNYAGGKAGGTILSTFTVKILSAGGATVGNTIYDFSGSSYHYNNDYGSKLLSITALPSSDLSLAKTTSNATPAQGAAFNYTLSVTNNGPSNASGIVVEDALPTGLTFAASNDCTETVGVVRCVVASLAANTSASVSFQVRVDADATLASTITNRAEIIAAGQRDPDSTPGNAAAGEDDLAAVDVTVSGVSLVKRVCNETRVDCSVSANFTDANRGAPGEVLVYRISYAVVAAPAVGLTLRDPLPGETALVEGAFGSAEAELTCPNGSSAALELGATTEVVAAVGAICSPGGPLAPGDSGTLAFKVEIE